MAEDAPGVVPDRPNHERGCVFRYGAVGDSGRSNTCSCPNRHNPEVLVPPWPDDEEHTKRWLADMKLMRNSR